MKKQVKMRRFLAILLAGMIIALMPMTAFAAAVTNNNLEDTTIDTPGDGSGNYDDLANPHVQGQSFNHATAQSADGSEWSVTGDDDAVDETIPAPGQQPDINVWAKVTEGGGSAVAIYKIDIEWGAMVFEYSDGSGEWDPATHSYVAAGGTPHWINDGNHTSEETSYPVGTNGTNNKITVTNHSNSAINAKFSYDMLRQSGQSGAAGGAVSPFNDGGGNSDPAFGEAYQEGVSGSYDMAGKHDVVGNFFGDNDAARRAHTVIANTGDGMGAMSQPSAWQVVNTAGDGYETISNAPDYLFVDAWLNDQAGQITKNNNYITLPTADWSTRPNAGVTDGTATWLAGVPASSLHSYLPTFNTEGDATAPKYKSGPRSASVYFAFSGQPDKGQSAFLSSFSKVGTITISIAPNNHDLYNTKTP